MNDDTAAKQAITEVIYRYCRAVDRMDRGLIATIWHPDGTADYGVTYQGSAAGLIDNLWANHAKLLGHSHQVTNILIEVDGDVAGSEAYVNGFLWELTQAGTRTSLSRGGGRQLNPVSAFFFGSIEGFVCGFEHRLGIVAGVWEHRHADRYGDPR